MSRAQEEHEGANVSCSCGGEFEPIKDSPDFFKCQQCGKELHQVAGRHLDLLEDLSDNDDPAIADLADAILAFKRGGDR